MQTSVFRINEDDPDTEAMRIAGETLRAGGLVAFPTETVYGLGGNALDPEASEKIYRAKGRPSDNPLIVHIADIADLETVAADIPEAGRKLAERFWPGPLTMIFRKTDAVPYETTGGLDTVAVRFPSNKTAQALIKAGGGFVAAPSANISGRPSPTSAGHVIDDLDGRIDVILDGGDTDIGLESTIVDLTEETPVILRPGYINEEMLSEALGEVRTDPGIVSDTEKPKAPGMKYRHYAPAAPLYIVEGERGAVTEKIKELAREYAAKGLKTCIICDDESLTEYPGYAVYSAGSFCDEDEIAGRLYSLLRRMDDEKADVILSEAFDTPRLGKAIMNRLLKAAGHNVIKA